MLPWLLLQKLLIIPHLVFNKMLFKPMIVTFVTLVILAIDPSALSAQVDPFGLGPQCMTAAPPSLNSWHVEHCGTITFVPYMTNLVDVPCKGTKNIQKTWLSMLRHGSSTRQFTPKPETPNPTYLYISPTYPQYSPISPEIPCFS